YPAMLAATSPFGLQYEYRYGLDEGKVDGGRIDGLRDSSARIDARYAGAGAEDRRVELGLGPVLERFRSARSEAATLRAVGAIGRPACALANLGLVGALTNDRRSGETRLSRIRGASPLQTLAAQTAEGILIAVPAGLLGWLLAVVAVDARASSLS